MNFSNIKLANIAFQGTSRDVLNSEADLNSKDLPVSKPLKADEVLNSMDAMANTARIEIKGKGKPLHILKKRLYDPVVLENMVSNWSDEEKNIGCMPESWIRGLKKDEIGAKTKEVHKLFAEFARSISVLTSREYMQDAEKMISQLEDR